jgi:hypothetical protein
VSNSVHELAPPRAAAVAGMIFSVLLSVSLIIIRIAVPPYQSDSSDWLSEPIRRTATRFAIHLVPFAGIAFLWFLGVLRNRLGALEDQFFATVFFGSGLLFVASLFVSATLAGALLEAKVQGETEWPQSETYGVLRMIIGASMNVFGLRSRRFCC